MYKSMSQKSAQFVERELTLCSSSMWCGRAGWLRRDKSLRSSDARLIYDVVIILQRWSQSSVPMISSCCSYGTPCLWFTSTSGLIKAVLTDSLSQFLQWCVHACQRSRVVEQSECLLTMSLMCWLYYIHLAWLWLSFACLLVDDSVHVRCEMWPEIFVWIM